MSQIAHSCRIRIVALLCGTFAFTGCVPMDADYSKAVTAFQTSANTLTQAYLVLLNNENALAESVYLDSHASRSLQISYDDLAKTAKVTPEQIKIRTAALAALSAYMTALAGFAAGAPAAKLQADATAANTSLQALTSLAGVSGPVSAGAAAMIAVVDLIAKHAGERDVRNSIELSKDKIAALFARIDEEASNTYKVQKNLLETRERIAVETYNAAAEKASADRVSLLALSDRVQQAQKDLATATAADPAPAIAALQKAYQALLDAIAAPKNKKKDSLATVLADVETFQTAVGPLEANTAAFARTL